MDSDVHTGGDGDTQARAAPGGSSHSQPRKLEYIIQEEIGRGSFATVYRATNSMDGQTYAIKSVARDKLNRKLAENLETEILILKRFHHSNIVRLLQYIKTDMHINLVMEFCSLGDLSHYIRKRGLVGGPTLAPGQWNPLATPWGGLSPEVTRHFLAQLSNAMEFLHRNRLIHRDLKPQNVLLVPAPRDSPLVKIMTPQGVRGIINVPSVSVPPLPLIKLADFGFARSLSSQSLASTLCGSPLYMAPEILKGVQYDDKVDLWSLGAIMFEMVASVPPFKAGNHVELLRKINTGDGCIAFPGDKVQYVPAGLNPTSTVAPNESGMVPVDTMPISAPRSSKWKDAHIPEDIKDLTRKLLRRNPKKRIDYNAFLMHYSVILSRTFFNNNNPGLAAETENKGTRSRSKQGSSQPQPQQKQQQQQQQQQPQKQSTKTQNETNDTLTTSATPSRKEAPEVASIDTKTDTDTGPKNGSNQAKDTLPHTNSIPPISPVKTNPNSTLQLPKSKPESSQQRQEPISSTTNENLEVDSPLFVTPKSATTPYDNKKQPVTATPTNETSQSSKSSLDVSYQKPQPIVPSKSQPSHINNSKSKSKIGNKSGSNSNDYGPLVFEKVDISDVAEKISDLKKQPKNGSNNTSPIIGNMSSDLQSTSNDTDRGSSTPNGIISQSLPNNNNANNWSKDSTPVRPTPPSIAKTSSALTNNILSMNMQKQQGPATTHAVSNGFLSPQGSMNPNSNYGTFHSSNDNQTGKDNKSYAINMKDSNGELAFADEDDVPLHPMGSQPISISRPNNSQLNGYKGNNVDNGGAIEQIKSFRQAEQDGRVGAGGVKNGKDKSKTKKEKLDSSLTKTNGNGRASTASGNNSMVVDDTTTDPNQSVLFEFNSFEDEYKESTNPKTGAYHPTEKGDSTQIVSKKNVTKIVSQPTTPKNRDVAVVPDLTGSTSTRGETRPDSRESGSAGQMFELSPTSQNVEDENTKEDSNGKSTEPLQADKRSRGDNQVVGTESSAHVPQNTEAPTNEEPSIDSSNPAVAGSKISKLLQTFCDEDEEFGREFQYIETQQKVQQQQQQQPQYDGSRSLLSQSSQRNGMSSTYGDSGDGGSMGSYVMDPPMRTGYSSRSGSNSQLMVPGSMDDNGMANVGSYQSGAGSYSVSRQRQQQYQQQQQLQQQYGSSQVQATPYHMQGQYGSLPTSYGTPGGNSRVRSHSNSGFNSGNSKLSGTSIGSINRTNAVPIMIGTPSSYYQQFYNNHSQTPNDASLSNASFVSNYSGVSYTNNGSMMNRGRGGGAGGQMIIQADVRSRSNSSLYNRPNGLPQQQTGSANGSGSNLNLASHSPNMIDHTVLHSVGTPSSYSSGFYNGAPYHQQQQQQQQVHVSSVGSYNGMAMYPPQQQQQQQHRRGYTESGGSIHETVSSPLASGVTISKPVITRYSSMASAPSISPQLSTQSHSQQSQASQSQTSKQHSQFHVAGPNVR